MKGPAALLTAVLSTAALVAAPPAERVPTPESVLGFRPGTDRTLADWGQIGDYFKKLDAASERVRVDEVGRTTEGHPFLVVTISSEANLARLEELRRVNARLADPRGLDEAEAERLLAGGKTIVALNHGIHSTEVAASQTSMETAFALAVGTDPWTREVLDQVVVVMLPSHNPDGTQKVTEWYRRSLGTPWEGGAVPFLYQKYVGHDNNRDWYMFTQVESRLTVEHLYRRWHPQIVHDLHQMGPRGPRIFAPPYVDPWEPNVDPALRSAVTALGTHVAARLTSEGKTGVAVHAYYDAWTPARAYPHTHGGVRILTECASARLATPLDVPWSGLTSSPAFDARQVAWNFPNPWPGGTWRVRDIMDYQLSATRAILEHAARNRDFWLRSFLGVNRRAAGRSAPFAFVVPTEQRDPRATGRLLEVLGLGEVEVHRARAPFEAAGRRFQAGSHVIPMAQPAGGFAKTVLERQQYPDLRLYPGGPPRRPYDVTAHTLPLLLGVEVATVESAFEADLERVADPGPAPGRVEGRGRLLALAHTTGPMAALGPLLEAGVPVRWALESFTDRGRRYEPGTLLLPASARAKVEPLARDLGFDARAVSASPKALALRRPRVGLYQSWQASMDEGWTRFIFEKEMGVAYTTLHDAQVRPGGLRARFDVVVLPDQSADEILAGHGTGTLPEEYTGGLGPEGIASLKAFVEEGGTLVALNAATRLALAHFGTRTRNALAGVPATDFYCPGALLRVDVDATHPLGHGLADPGVVWFEESPAFELEEGRAVMRYEEEEPLLSGWLLGGPRLKGKAALAEVPVGRGRLVLFGFRPQYRAQSWATYVALLNALYLAAATPAG